MMMIDDDDDDVSDDDGSDGDDDDDGTISAFYGRVSDEEHILAGNGSSTNRRSA